MLVNLVNIRSLAVASCAALLFVAMDTTRVPSTVAAPMVADVMAVSMANPFEMMTEGNLQVGVPEQLLPLPIAVKTRPGVAVEFFSFDMAVMETTGSDSAVVIAGADGIANIPVRLGRNTGLYSVIARPADEDGPTLLFRLRCITEAQMKERSSRFGLGLGPTETRSSSPGGER